MYTPVSFTNKTDRHDITEIFFKVALNTINLLLYSKNVSSNSNQQLFKYNQCRTNVLHIFHWVKYQFLFH